MGEVSSTPRSSWPVRLLRAPLGTVRKVVAVLPQAVDGYFAQRLTQHAAGIAYRVLFSLAPLAIILVSVFGLVLQNDALREDVTDWIVDWLPVSDEGSADIERAITNLASPASALGLLSLLVFAWAATGMMASIRTGLEAAMGVPRSRPAVRGKLVDFVLVAAAGALVLVAVGLSIATQLVTRLTTDLSERLGLDGGLIDQTLRTGAPLLLSCLVIILLYRFVPAHRIRIRDAFAGAIVAALLMLAISAGSAYIYNKTARLSVIYGSITVALVFLYSVYLYASALLFGAEVAAAWSRPLTGPGAPIIVQVKQAVLGLFVNREPEQPAPPDERKDADYQGPPPAGSGTEAGRTTKTTPPLPPSQARSSWPRS